MPSGEKSFLNRIIRPFTQEFSEQYRREELEEHKARLNILETQYQQLETQRDQIDSSNLAEHLEEEFRVYSAILDESVDRRGVPIRARIKAIFE